MQLQPQPHPYSSEESHFINQQQQQQFLFFLQQDLDAALQREQMLRDELHNVTARATGLQRREELHLHQLDVLTERVLDVEATAARDQNTAIELKANCSALAQQFTMATADAQKWQTQCQELLELRQQEESKLRDIKKKLKVAQRQSEGLAEMIERHRLREEGTEFHAVNSKKKKKRRGLLGWLWSLAFGSGDDETTATGNVNDDDEDAYEEMQGLARSTLLAALQTERNSVSELETVVSTLQQNNSAIAEQVQSRDLIIEELNNRVAVFEEDKLVLKAALRQLQKEMNEEAPKTQKLVSDLQTAKKEVGRLKAELEQLQKTHKKELSGLQKVIRQKEEKAKAIESNLTVIGNYVDKLEERLADFTVARREIEKREKACQRVEQKAANITSEKQSLTVQVAGLQAEVLKLTADFDVLQKEAQMLREACTKLESEVKELNESNETWRVRTEQAQRDLNSTKAVKERLVQQLELSESEKAQLRQQVQSVSSSQQQHINMLEQAANTKAALERRITELEAQHQSSTRSSEDVMEEMKRALEEQKQLLETARQEQQRAVAEAQKAMETASRAESERLNAVAAAGQAAQVVSQMKSAEQARKKVEDAAARAAEEQKLAEKQAASREAPGSAKQPLSEKENDSTGKVEDETAGANSQAGDFDEPPKNSTGLPTDEAGNAEPANATQQENDIKARSPQSMLMKGDADQHENVDQTNDVAAKLGIGTNSTEFPFDPLVKPIPYVYPDMRPKEAEKAPLLPPYLPKSASAPKRQFGSGLVVQHPNIPASKQSPTSHGSTGPPLMPTNATKTAVVRKVRLRKVRKAFAKATGVHGLFTTPSSHPRSIRPEKKNVTIESQKTTHSSKSSATVSAAVSASNSAKQQRNVSLASSGVGTASSPPPSKQRNVPLRKVRKFFAKTTGIHGLFSIPSTPRPRKKLPAKTEAKAAGMSTPAKPNQMNHTLAGLRATAPPLQNSLVKATVAQKDKS